MAFGLKIYIKAFSNVFYLAFPIIFAQCIYHINSTPSFETMQQTQDNYKFNKNDKFDKTQNAKSVNQKLNSEYEPIDQFLIVILDKFPMMIFKIFIVIFLVGLWKAKVLEKLMKMGIV